MTSSSIAAELWALKDGLALCVKLQAQFVEVELDVSATISLVSSNINSNRNLSGLVDDCRDLLQQLPQVQLSHCFREANCCVDALASMGSSHADISLHFAAPPPQCYPSFLC